MKISIIVPIFNVEKYIIECLNSISKQDFDGDLECILVDDCGRDNSMSLVDDFIKAYSGNIQFKVIHHEHNRGLSAARNTGMDCATGDYIFFLDSDDLLANNCMSLFKTFIKEKGIFDVVVCEIALLGGKESDLPKIKDSMPETLYGSDIIKSLTQTEWFVLAQSKFYLREFLKKNKLLFKEGIIHEDNLWTFDIASHAKSLGVIRGALYFYRIHEGSIMTSTKVEKRINSLITIISEIQKRIVDDVQEASTKYYYMHMLVFTAMWIAISNLSENECRRFYSEIRSAVKWDMLKTIKNYGFNAKQVVRYIHFSMPQIIGFKVCTAVCKRCF